MFFVTHAAELKLDILLPQPLNHPFDTPPDLLPLSVALFLASSIGIPFCDIQECWSALKWAVWEHPGLEEAERAEVEAYRDHGLKHGIGEPHYSYVMYH